MKAALLAIALVGCGADAFSPSVDAGTSDGAMTSDAGGPCEVSIAITPANPEAGDHVHAMAVVTNLLGVPTYTWTVDGVGSTAYEAPDDSAIGFDVPIAAMHTIDLAITGTISFCPPASLPVDVGAGSGATALYRLRVIAPASYLAPPYETEVLVRAGTPTPRDVGLDPGEDLPGTVTSGTTGVPAYLEFVPSSGPPIEAFSALMTGAFDARVALVPYQVLVVPEIPGFAPRSFAWTPGTPASFAVDAGTTINGSVLAPGGGPLANAQVQLASNGVPSTIATTAADGTFSVLAAFSSGPVSVSVTPPAGSGLARLAATTTLAPPLQIAYAAATSCDLAGDVVQRGGVAQAGAQVTIVGTVASAGTIGGTSATGTVNVTTTANASGVLPSTPVPRASLQAIVQVATGDFAVAALDTSGCAAQTIVAPPQVANAGIVAVGTTPLANARVEATPAGTLALATLVPIDAMTASDGSFTLPFASGAAYDVRVNDLRGAPFAALDVATVPASITLGSGLVIEGKVSVLGSVVTGAAVELLCASCTGLDADRPIMQTATDTQGQYELSVADPGSM
jgi:hypothetical protein